MAGRWWSGALGGLVFASTVSAQAPAPPSATAADIAARPPGAITPAQPVPGSRYRLVPRSYNECLREARARRYRGSERRHYVERCQIGLRRLFRGRGPQLPAAAPGGGAQPSPAVTPAPAPTR